MQLYNLYIIIAIHCPICQHIRLLFYGKYSTARIPACIIMQFLCFWKLSTISVIHHKVDKTHYSITQWVLARNGINEHTILVHTPTYAGRDACTCTRTVQQTVQCTNTQCQSSKSNSVCAQQWQHYTLSGWGWLALLFLRSLINSAIAFGIGRRWPPSWVLSANHNIICYWWKLCKVGKVG